MSSAVNITTGKGSASALAGAAEIPSSVTPNGGHHLRNGTLIPGGKDLTKPPPATEVAVVKKGRSRCSRSRSHEMNSLAGGKVYNHDSANDPSDAGIDPFAFSGSRRDKSFVRSGSIKRDARIEGGEVFLSGRRKPTGLSTIIGSDNDGHGGEVALDDFPRQEILLTGSGVTAAPSNDTNSSVSSRSGFGSGSRRRNSRRTLVEWFRDDGDDREGEKIGCHGVTPARSRGSSAAVGDVAIAGVSGLRSGRDRRVLGNADDAVVERGSRNRAGRKLADWVKGAGVDDSDGDTILSGNTSPKSVMTPSPVAFSPAYPPSVSRSEENAYRGIIPKYPESHSPMTETRDGWSAGRPIFAEKEQSAGQETDSLDAVGEAAAAAAAAAVLADVVDAPVGDERGGDMVADGFVAKGNGAVAAGSENEITLERDVAEAATAEAGATAVKAEEGVSENMLAVDVADGGGAGPGIGEVDAGNYGTWKWSTPVDEEPAVDLEVEVAVAATGSSVEQDGRTPRAGSSKGLVPASASSPNRVGDTAEGAGAVESGVDNAVHVPPTDNGRGVNGGGVSRRVASFPLSGGNVCDLRRRLDRRSSGRSGLSVRSGVRSGMGSGEFGGNVSGGADSSVLLDVGIGSGGMSKGKSGTGSGGIQNGSGGTESDGMLKGKSGTKSGGIQNGSGGNLEGKSGTGSGGMQNGSGGMLKRKSGTESGGMQNGSDGNLEGKSGTGSGGMQNGSGGMLKGKSGTESGGIESDGMLKGKSGTGSGGIESVGTGNSVMHGESGSALGMGSGRRWRVDSNKALALKTRRSLSVGGSSKSGSESRVAVDSKGVMTDGDEASELSPVGCEIAYMKQQRSTIGKGDKSTGGRTLGSWPNKAKKDADSAKVIYLGDIDFDAPGKATATDILVRQHRTRVRVKRVKDKASANNKKKPRAKPRRRIRNGKPLHPEEDEVEYMLTIGMMLGLRVAVGRQAGPLAKLELTVEDFYQVDKYTFPPSGATGGYLVTPSHKLGQTFKFKDYAPKVFKKIREHFGVDKMRYMLSVAGNYNFLEFISNAKSGEFFFFSHDERFMIKTMKSSETKFLRRILPHYYEHVKVHPETFLVRFYGMYRVKMHHINRKVHFIVMNSVLDTYKEIHRTFDLKGSSLGRSAKPGEKVLKDNDLAEKQGKLHLGSQRDAFLKVVRADSQFLARMKIMDYSLLTGIHDRAKRTEEDQHQSPRRYSKFFNFADEAENRAIPGFKRVPGKLPSATPKAYSAPVKGDIKKHDVGGVALEMDFSGGGQGEGNGRSNSRDGERPEEFPSSVVYLRSAGSSQSEIVREGLLLRKNRSKRSTGEFDEALSEMVPVSASEFDGPSDTFVPSDEDPTSGGPWSATGTGTEEDTGGDYTEGDGEYETPSENAAGGDAHTGPPRELSLSRCSTAQGNLSHWQAAEEVKGRGGPNVARRSTRRRSPPMFRPTPEPRLAPPETGVSLSILRRADGGVDSETNGKRGRDIYFMGIIDILQEYNARKHGETFFKSLAHDRAEISCVDPQTYSQRFNDFLERHTD